MKHPPSYKKGKTEIHGAYFWDKYGRRTFIPINKDVKKEIEDIINKTE